MQLSSAPSQLVLPWANGGTKNSIPVPSQIPITPGAASWTDGYPPLTSIDPASGGVPPARADLNGGLFSMSAVDVWMSAGAGFPYSSAFSTAVGGYPQGSRVLRATGYGYWLSTVDNNVTDPDTGGAGWIPDRAVSGVYASAQQTIASGNAKILYDTVEFDSLGLWNSGAQRFVAKWPGLYRLSGSLYLPSAAPQNLATEIWKNGVFDRICCQFPQVSDIALTYPFHAIENCAANDYLEPFLNSTVSVLAGIVGANPSYVYAQLEYLGNG